jgi:hypothetical protein
MRKLAEVAEDLIKSSESLSSSASEPNSSSQAKVESNPPAVTSSNHHHYHSDISTSTNNIYSSSSSNMALQDIMHESSYDSSLNLQDLLNSPIVNPSYVQPQPYQLQQQPQQLPQQPQSRPFLQTSHYSPREAAGAGGVAGLMNPPLSVSSSQGSGNSWIVNEDSLHRVIRHAVSEELERSVIPLIKTDHSFSQSISIGHNNGNGISPRSSLNMPSPSSYLKPPTPRSSSNGSSMMPMLSPLGEMIHQLSDHQQQSYSHSYSQPPAVSTGSSSALAAPWHSHAAYEPFDMKQESPSSALRRSIKITSPARPIRIDVSLPAPEPDPEPQPSSAPVTGMGGERKATVPRQADVDARKELKQQIQSVESQLHSLLGKEHLLAPGPSLPSPIAHSSHRSDRRATPASALASAAVMMQDHFPTSILRDVDSYREQPVNRSVYGTPQTATAGDASAMTSPAPWTDPSGQYLSLHDRMRSLESALQAEHQSTMKVLEILMKKNDATALPAPSPAPAVSAMKTKSIRREPQQPQQQQVIDATSFLSSPSSKDSIFPAYKPHQSFSSLSPQPRHHHPQPEREPPPIKILTSQTRDASVHALKQQQHASSSTSSTTSTARHSVSSRAPTIASPKPHILPPPPTLPHSAKKKT